MRDATSPTVIFTNHLYTLGNVPSFTDYATISFYYKVGSPHFSPGSGTTIRTARSLTRQLWVNTVFHITKSRNGAYGKMPEEIDLNQKPYHPNKIEDTISEPNLVLETPETVIKNEFKNDLNSFILSGNRKMTFDAASWLFQC